MNEFFESHFYEMCFEASLQFVVSGIVFGEVRANLNDHYHYPVQFSRLICRKRKRNKTGVLHRFFAIGFTKSSLEQSLWFLKKLNNRELCLVRYEPISMTNIFIRCSSPGLFAEGVKEIRRVYCAGSGSIFFTRFSFVESLKKSVRDRNENPSGKKIVVKSPVRR